MTTARLALAFAGVALAFACASTLPCPVCPPCPACPECPATAAEKPAAELRWFVLRIKDGDTLVARLDGGPTERLETIRLLNVDTPEKNQPGWSEATEALKYLVRGGYIDLDFEKPGVEKRDGFGRLLAYVMAGDVNVNLELVRQGWSKLYTKYGKGRLHEQFVAAEAEARAARRGLWGMEDAVNEADVISDNEHRVRCSNLLLSLQLKCINRLMKSISVSDRCNSRAALRGGGAAVVGSKREGQRHLQKSESPRLSPRASRAGDGI